MSDISDRARGCLLGLACGDAVGTTIEFKPRGAFPPVEDMVGGGPFHLEPGQWTDDTSMALCLAESLVTCGGFDPMDQMERYVRWVEDGYMSSTGRCFDIGNTTSQALRTFRDSGDPMSGPTDPHSAGNGSIMRLAPVVLCYYPDPDEVDRYAAESSRTTHGAATAVAGCRILGGILLAALNGAGKSDVSMAVKPADWMSPELQDIARGAYQTKQRDEIRGSGYVVECLEAALWCFLKTASFKEAILEAANLGNDADTTAAVCGQVAGAFYGIDGIPARWLDKLAMRPLIEDLVIGCIEISRQ